MSISPGDLPFAARAEAFLDRFETAIDGVADDLDIDVLRTGNVITLTFDNDHRMVINSQEAAGEIWVAARAGGFHYRWDAGAAAWRDTRSGDAFGTAVARLIATETGAAPALDL